METGEENSNRDFRRSNEKWNSMVPTSGKSEASSLILLDRGKCSESIGTHAQEEIRNSSGRNRLFQNESAEE